MKPCRMLRLVRGAGEAPLEARFPESGLLLLVSHRGELALAAEVADGALAHLALVARGKKCFAIALRADAGIDGHRAGLLQRHSIMTVGRSELRVAPVSHDSRIATWRGTLVLIGLVALLATTIFLVHPSPQPQPQPSIESFASATTPPSSVLDEARDHLRQGRIEQARLALLAEIERDPAGEGSRLLAAVAAEARTSHEAEAAAAAAEGEAQARVLYDRGRTKLQQGAAVAALRDLRAAGEIAAKLPALPTFAAALAEAEAAAARALAPQVKQLLEQARRLSAAARNKDAPGATEKLAQAVASADEAGKLFPGHEGAEQLAASLRQELAAASARGMAAAAAAERLAGCSRAAPIYRRMSQALAAADPERSRQAAESGARCPVAAP